MRQKGLKRGVGIPYKGGKRYLSKHLVDIMLDKYPNTKYVYDLMGGVELSVLSLHNESK